MGAGNPADLTVVNSQLAIIRARAEGMGIYEETGFTLTTDGTEQDIYMANLPRGIFLPLIVRVGMAANTATEKIIIKEYYKGASGGAFLLADSMEILGPYEKEWLTVELEPARFGANVTITKLAGTNREYPCEVLYQV